MHKFQDNDVIKIKERKYETDTTKNILVMELNALKRQAFATDFSVPKIYKKAKKEMEQQGLNNFVTEISGFLSLKVDFISSEIKHRLLSKQFLNI